MQHARDDYNVIQDTTAARKLAELVLDMQMVTDKGLVARQLAREVLGIADHGRAPELTPITTNGTTRLIPDNEPVFLVRGQDVVGAATVRAWADMAHDAGAAPEIVRSAREHAEKMAAWPKKKVADLKTSDAKHADTMHPVTASVQDAGLCSSCAEDLCDAYDSTSTIRCSAWKPLGKLDAATEGAKQ